MKETKQCKTKATTLCHHCSIFNSGIHFVWHPCLAFPIQHCEWETSCVPPASSASFVCFDINMFSSPSLFLMFILCFSSCIVLDALGSISHSLWLIWMKGSFAFIVFNFCYIFQGGDRWVLERGSHTFLPLWLGTSGTLTKQLFRHLARSSCLVLGN